MNSLTFFCEENKFSVNQVKEFIQKKYALKTISSFEYLPPKVQKSIRLEFQSKKSGKQKSGKLNVDLSPLREWYNKNRNNKRTKICVAVKKEFNSNIVYSPVISSPFGGQPGYKKK